MDSTEQFVVAAGFVVLLTLLLWAFLPPGWRSRFSGDTPPTLLPDRVRSLEKSISGLTEAVTTLVTVYRERDTRAKGTAAKTDSAGTSDERVPMFPQLADRNLSDQRLEFFKDEAERQAQHARGPVAAYVNAVHSVYSVVFEKLEIVASSDRGLYFELLKHFQEPLYLAGLEEWGSEWIDRRWSDYLQAFPDHPRNRYVISDGQPIRNPDEAVVIGIRLPGFRWTYSRDPDRYRIASYPKPTIS